MPPRSASNPNPFTASPARVDDEPLRPAPSSRHVLRPIEEYQEFEEEDRLRIPRDMIPDGFDMLWVTQSVFGRPESQHFSRFVRQGWVAVHQEDFDGRFRGMFMPASYEGEIAMDGLVLMARSRAWTDKARANDLRRARERVNIKERQLLNGALTGVTLAPDHPTAVRNNIINHSVEQIAVPPSQS